MTDHLTAEQYKARIEFPLARIRCARTKLDRAARELGTIGNLPTAARAIDQLHRILADIDRLGEDW